ncbi:hypothetical protein A2U01_0097110, partial [Trifolium medium]|nr:hypothetical protein [Trifolium medium]
PESDAVADAAVEALTESNKVTELLGKFDTVRDMLKDLLISDELANDSRVYQVIQDAMKVTSSQP